MGALGRNQQAFRAAVVWVEGVTVPGVDSCLYECIGVETAYINTLYMLKSICSSAVRSRTSLSLRRMSSLFISFEAVSMVFACA